MVLKHFGTWSLLYLGIFDKDISTGTHKLQLLDTNGILLSTFMSEKFIVDQCLPDRYFVKNNAGYSILSTVTLQLIC